MARQKKPRESVKVEVSVDLEDVRNGEDEPRLTAFAFTSGGTLIDQAEVEGGSAALEIPGRDEPQGVRVVVGPSSFSGDEAPLAGLLRLEAATRTVRLQPKKSLETKFVIPRPDWLCWLLSRCTVRGTLVKRVPGDGPPLDLPVCNAEVEVYEVDSVAKLIPRIPDDALDLVRKIVRLLPPWPPKREPWPPEPELLKPHGPGPDPAPILAKIQELRAIAQTPVAVPGSPVGIPEPPAEGFALEPGEAAAADGERTLDLVPQPSEPPGPEEAAEAIMALAGSESILRAAGRGTTSFRNALLRDPELFQPLICSLFPHFVTKQLVATATTDGCGHFQATFYQGCSSDTPDLDFAAFRHLFNNVRVPIYQPTPVSCYTHWDYVCGTEVTLRTTSPLAPVCRPCGPIIAKPHWVAVMGIGNTPLSRIHGTSPTLNATADTIGLTDRGAPFGGLLRLHLEFDDALRDELGVCYYRVSWRKAGTGNPWVALDREVHRHYVQPDSASLEALSLGPRVVGGKASLFEIPPAAFNGGSLKVAEQVEDTTNAQFPTGGAGPKTHELVPPGAEGMYELQVELFDTDGAPVTLDEEKGAHFVVPIPTDLSGSIDMAEAAPLGLVPGPPNGTGNAFVMQLHVDNNPTAAKIAPPLVNGAIGPDSKCGVIKYVPHGSDTLTVAYTASHPHGFANYRFTFKRGTNELWPPSSAGPVGTGSFSSTPSLSALLDECSPAGFATRLYVEGTATDGWSRQGYDAEDLCSFVLQQIEPKAKSESG